jgi:hypothetical protein
MAGFCPNEGEAFIADYVIMKTQTANRGTDLELGLFNTLSTDDETVTYSGLSKITSNLSANTITLTDGSWTGSADARSYAQQTFTATGTVTDVRGYYIATTGSAKRLLVVERDTDGPFTLNNGDTYKITPTITIA